MLFDTDFTPNAAAGFDIRLKINIGQFLPAVDGMGYMKISSLDTNEHKMTFQTRTGMVEAYKDDYPQLWSIAQKAAAENGVKLNTIAISALNNPTPTEPTKPDCCTIISGVDNKIVYVGGAVVLAGIAYLLLKK